MKIITCFSVPFFALVCKWVFRKKGYNFLELMVVFLYMFGTNFIISIIQIPSLMILSQNHKWSMPVLYFFGSFSVIFEVWTVCSFFNLKGFKGILKSIGVYILSMIVFEIFIFIIIGFFVLWKHQSGIFFK